MLCVSFTVFMLLGMYLDAILPSKFGKRRNPCYCLMPSFYSCCRRARSTPNTETETLLSDTNNEEDEAELSAVGQ
jgi:hypothetical protein